MVKKSGEVFHDPSRAVKNEAGAKGLAGRSGAYVEIREHSDRQE
ncbi:MAG: hypothetical protein ACOY30_03715 [Bacillota bacterium]